jgi:TPR repeat protein
VTGRVGKRSEADFHLAADLLGKAANQGLAIAQFYFGVMNERGVGMPRDVDAAVGWYRKAASQGDPNARQALTKLATN